MPHLFIPAMTVTLYGDVIGSVLNRVSSQSSSVVMAYWPRYGSDITVIDYSRMNVGIVQFFMKYTVTLKSNETISKFDHVFAFVVREKMHEDVGYFGISANVCVNDCEPYSNCNIPVQRIAAKSAFCLTDITNSYGIEGNVFLACPISIKFTT